MRPSPATLLPLLRMVSTAAAPTLRSSCFCGALELRVAASAPLGSSCCHCTTCRALSGAPFIANVLLAKADAALTLASGGGAPQEPRDIVSLETSRQVRRIRCARCHSPMFATLGEKRVVVPLAAFARKVVPDTWLPKQHIWYGSRVIDVNDGAPKYVRNYGGLRCADDGQPLAEEEPPRE